MMRHLKILLAGITFALLTDILGIAVGVVKCISSGIEINGSALLSVALGAGAKEGIYIGLVVVILMLIGTRGSRPPH
ncbi:hypothetical protein GCM10027066_00040 [Dyella jejuensis]